MVFYGGARNYSTFLPCNQMIDYFFGNIFARLTLDISSNFVAVHVRHGDKATETATFHLDKYMPGIRHLSNAHGTRNIFVSTEDQVVIDALRLSGIFIQIHQRA